jgi:dTDP-4-amino-4,6-dideoxygalactose transaminase
MTLAVPFLDLRVSTRDRHALLEALDRVFAHGQFILGQEVSHFEDEIAKRCSRQFSVGVGSGSDALYLALRALDIGPGDEVITPCLSWIATANAIALVGADPVFADIKPDLNLDPSSVKRLLTPKTKAILAVNYTGRICDMDALTQIAGEANIFLIEDGSQSFGATFKAQPCGSFGTISAISHNPMKVFAAIGEAGSVLCNDLELANRLRVLRYNGTVNREKCVEPSINGRIDTVQAAVLLERLKSLSQVLEQRQRYARIYDARLEDAVRIPPKTPDNFDVYYTYTIQSSRRDALKDFLGNRGIETKIQHPILMCNQRPYLKFTRESTQAEALVKKILCLPIHENLSQAQIEHVAESIIEFKVRKSI